MDPLSDLPLPAVAAAALEETRHDPGNTPLPHVLELQRRATEEVLDGALRWTSSADPDERAALGWRRSSADRGRS